MTPFQRLVRRVFIIAIVLVSYGTNARSQFTVEQIMSSPFPSDLTASANGERIAWVFCARGERNVWIADGPEFVNAHQVTKYAGDDGQQIASLRLTPDGRTIVYVRGSETNGAGEVANPMSLTEAPKQLVYAAEVDSGVPRLLGEMGISDEGGEDVQLSPDGQWAVWAAKRQLWMAAVGQQPPGEKRSARQITAGHGTNDSPQWSPDGKRIAFVSSRGDHAFIAVLDVGTNAVRYLAPSFDRDGLPRWSPDSRRIVFVRTAGRERRLPMIPLQPTPWSIWVADAQTGEGKSIWYSAIDRRSTLPRMFEGSALQFTADDRIVFASEQDGRNHLYSIPSGSGPVKLLTPGEFDVEDVTMAHDGRTLIYTSNQNDTDRRHLWRVPADGSAPPQAMTMGASIEWSPVEIGAGRELVCLGSTATSPAMPYRIRDGHREMIAPAALPADFPSSQLIEPREVTFKSEDGLTIHGQLFVPKGTSSKDSKPALVFTHGGPPRQMLLGFHYMRYYHNAYAENQYLASRGFVVLSVNYRLGIMYGRDFREPTGGGWRGSSEYRDVVAGGRYLQSLPIVDRKKIGLWGGSYGGLLTALGLARNSDIFKAGVDFHGVHDWSAIIARRLEPGNDPPDLEKAVQLAWQSSPVASIEHWKSPVLLIQGDDDRNVAISQTVDLVQRLREHRIPFEQIMIPDEIHDFLLWKSWVRAYMATSDFFERVLVRGESVR